MRNIDYVGLTLYLFGSQIRSDFNRYYLGTLWWFLEPCLYVVVFYLIFLNLKGRSESFLYLLMCGLTTWKWFTSLINQGASSLVQAKAVVANFNVHPFVFPLVSLMVNTFKYLVVLLALLVLLQQKEVLIFSGGLSFIIWFITSMTVLFSYQVILSSILPFLPDLKVIIGNLMMLLMFMSGVIFPINSMPLDFQILLFWNPFVYLIEGIRSILILGEDLNLKLYLFLFGIHLLVLLLGFNRLTRLKGEIPKRMV